MATSTLERLNIWTIPNAITGFRLVLAPFTVWFIHSAVKSDGLDLFFLVVALIALVIGEITDLADGIIARRTGSVSDLGKLLDLDH